MQVTTKQGVQIHVEDRMNTARKVLLSSYKKLFPAHIKDSNLSVHVKDDETYYITVSPVDGITCLIWCDDGETSEGSCCLGEKNINNEVYNYRYLITDE